MAEQRPGDAAPAAKPPRLHIEHLWLSLPVFLVVWSGFRQQGALLDFWWHLKTGEVILDTGSIPRTDEFSYTAAGTPSVPYCWLAQVVYALAVRAGGLPLLVLLNTAVLVATLLPVYHLCLERARPYLRPGVVAAFLPAGALAVFGAIRPQVFSFALFAYFYWVLAGYQGRRRDLLWTLPPLAALWVNLHGAFVMGLGLVALYLGCEAVRRLARGPAADTLTPRELVRLAVVLALAAAATLLNPETYQIYEFVRSIQASAVVRRAVIEWQAPRLDDPQGRMAFFGPFFLVLLALLAGRPRLTLTELVLFLGATAFGLTAIRNGIWFSLLAAPLAAAGLRQGVRRTFGPPRAAARPRPKGEGVVVGLFFAVLLGITVLASPWLLPGFGLARFGRKPWVRETPVGAVDYIEQHNLEGRIFHPQSYGDYLVWRLWPRQRSFIDGRTHLFDGAFVQSYLETLRTPDWQERLAAHDVRYLLLSKTDPIDQALIENARAAAGWRVLYEDDVSVLFGRAPES
jgi:hypothetical protein